MPGEWSLNQKVFKQISEMWGETTIDVKAMRYNTQVQIVCSLYKEDDPLAVDAITLPWKFPLAYVFPPLAVIQRVLSKKPKRISHQYYYCHNYILGQEGMVFAADENEPGLILGVPPLVSQGSQKCSSLQSLKQTAWRLMGHIVSQHSQMYLTHLHRMNLRPCKMGP